ncbi:MAG: hypothetical protein J5526_03330 [Bacteroidales bacterium]|nr:hypothetical protein [Bacteroidales bacterium]
MRGLIIRNILRFIALIVIQLFVLNNIYLGGYISPMLYAMFILMLPNRVGRIPTLLIGFVLGLSIDVCSNMLGFHACATTVMAFCRIMFAEKIITRGEDISIDTPSIYSVAPQFFIYYSALLLFIHSLVFFMLDYFNFADIFKILLSSVLTTLATLVLVLIWQMLFNHKRRTK